MEFQGFDNVKLEKEEAVLSLNRFCRVARLWQVFEVLVFLMLVSWSSARAPAVLKVAGGYFVEFSRYMFNHHAVFLMGNAIIVCLFVLCRLNNGVSTSGDGDFYDDYVKHIRSEPDLPPVEIGSSTVEECGCGNYGENNIVVQKEEITALWQRDDAAAAAIERAARKMKRFQRTQSEKLRREIAVRRRRELRRSETESRLRMESSGERTAAFDVAEIEKLSNEEFRRTIDAFIDKHWGRRRLEWNDKEG